MSIEPPHEDDSAVRSAPYTLEQTLSGVVKARDTVAIDTPACRATWRIDVARLEADEPPGLAGAIRLWLFSQKAL